MKLSNLKVATRLGVGFGAVVLMLVAIAAIAISRIHLINSSVDLILKDRFVKVQLATGIQMEIDTQARLLRNALIADDAGTIQAYFDRIHTSIERSDALVTRLKAISVAPQAVVLADELIAKQASYVDARNKFIALVKDGQDEAAGAFILKDMSAVQSAFFSAVGAMVDFQTQRMNDDGQEARDAGDSAIRITLGIAMAAALVAIGLAMLISRSITRPLARAVVVAETVASGDLLTRIDSDATDETGQLLRALKAMQESLTDVVGKVRSGTDTIATASSQIAAGNQDLSSRTEQQASSLEQTAASMEELTSTVKQNADNARQANQLAVSASDVAVKGGAVVGQVVTTMASIETSSRKIVDIISVIDSIAFQTNILALNAAVEAARAGEQGRGFAVVASEVRNLAQRSAAAAKEIKDLIDDSVGNVSAGTRLVEQAGQTMEEIVGSVQRVTDIMGEITAASQEQTTGIEQINQAITQMDQVTQQNAALVEEAASAASSLREQAHTLVSTVAVFKLQGALAM
ncbi:methyl-accepting chemotaxis protein [Variovorax ginsengisoli]|uniref:Methyl-accepting chemotaxis protein n=1 Tax=Variovorax ginsengisoli TaxID=363844 RepID=A0ABT9SEJ1_9BURK|nr:methyl-accepting chemotaxis protein [Variovorax ginsengisoli]MDP9902785.1 methyl-accepting chemotaxis protein [Variovorax ginsengisoli]